MSISKRNFESIAKMITEEARNYEWEEQWSEAEFMHTVSTNEGQYDFMAVVSGRMTAAEIAMPTREHPSEWELTRNMIIVSAEVFDSEGDILELESGEFYHKMFDCIDKYSTEVWYE